MTPQEQLRKFRETQEKTLSPQEQLRKFRESQPGGSSLGMKRAKSFEDLTSSSGQDEQMFDYKTGARGGLRAKMSFMETAEEKENFLRQRVGRDGFTKDSKGRLALTPEGQAREGMKPIDKNLVIDEKGFSLRDISDVAGYAPETIGSIIGGIIGAPTLVGGFLGAGAGAAAGQTIEEGIESLLGLQKQTAGEVATDVAVEAAIAGVGDVAGNLVFRAGKKALGLGGKAANAAARGMGTQQREVGSETADQLLKIMDKGGLPSYEAAGFGPGVSRISQTAEAISGNKERAIRNVSFALNEKERLLTQLGLDPKKPITSDELAKAISRSGPEKAKQLEAQLAKSQNAHIKAIDDTVKLLTKSTKEGAEIEDEVLKVLMKNYDEFLKTSDANWKQIDDTLNQVRGEVKVNGELIPAGGGEIPIFDVQAFKTMYDDVLRKEYDGATANAPEEFLEIGKALGQLVRNETRAGFTSFNGMKQLRKKIHDTLMDPKLSLGDTSARRELVKIEQRIDDMMYGKVPIKFEGIGRGNASIVKKAMKQLEKARQSYAEEIGTFRKLETLAILRNAGEAGKDVKLIVGRNFPQIVSSPDRVKAVIKASGERSDEVRNMLQQKFIDDALQNSGKDFADPDKFNGLQFFNAINGKTTRQVGEELFGNDWKEISALSRSLAYNGIRKMDNKVLENAIAQNPGDNIIITLKNIREAQVNLDEAMSTKVLRDLAEGKVDPEEAASIIVNPKTSRGQMDRILKYFKDDPVAKETIKNKLVSDILGSVNEDIFVTEQAASSLQNVLKSYKREMLNKVLGKEYVDELFEFANDLILLKDTGRKGAGSLAADAIRTGAVTNPMKNLPKVARFRGLNYIVNNPSTVRAGLELKAGRKNAQEAAKSVGKTLGIGAENSGSGALGETANKVMRGLGVANTVGVGARQAAARPIVNEVRGRGGVDQGVPPKRNTTPVPKVLPPVSVVDNLQVTQRVDPRVAQQQQSLRERAKRNPYVASTLLGGLGSAGLL